MPFSFFQWIVESIETQRTFSPSFQGYAKSYNCRYLPHNCVLPDGECGIHNSVGSKWYFEIWRCGCGEFKDTNPLHILNDTCRTSGRLCFFLSNRSKSFYFCKKKCCSLILFVWLYARYSWTCLVNTLERWKHVLGTSKLDYSCLCCLLDLWSC